MPDEIQPATPSELQSSTYHALVNTPLQFDEQTEEWGHWAPTVALMRRLGATEVNSLGLGLGVVFPQFSTESQVYPTRGVVAMSAMERFKLSDVVTEKRAFSVQLSAKPYAGFASCREAQAIDIGFAPMPDRPSGVDGVELARRFVVVLTGLLEKHPKLRTGELRHLNSASEHLLRA